MKAIAATMLMAITLAATAAEQPYPNRPIRIIVDNRAGANGITGMEATAKSKPDGYTIVLGVSSALAMNP